MTENYPEKIYVELTTRCNLRCPMCVKFAEGSCISEGDLPLDLFKKLGPSLAHVKSLVLNGIGEPLLHPDIEEIIGFARARMPADGIIGFQSNGILLDEQRAGRLVRAGLDTLCLSLDNLDLCDPGGDRSGGHAFPAVARAVANLGRAKRETDRGFRIGIETVLSRESVGDLPDIVAWAAGHGVDYVVATHLFLYGGANDEASLFNPNSTEAIAVFNKYNEMAARQGVDLRDYLATYLKFAKTPADLEVLRLVEAMQKEAREKDIHLHLRSLLENTGRNPATVEEAFRRAGEIATRAGIELYLPPLQAHARRFCPFIAEDAVFIAQNGDVMPCHFLWHSYACRVLGEEIQVRERVFGTLSEEAIETIWQKAEYRQFRREAAAGDYASCWSCSLGPCATLINDDQYANDCYGSQAPCGHCQWSLGGVRCL